MKMKCLKDLVGVKMFKLTTRAVLEKLFRLTICGKLREFIIAIQDLNLDC
jgi:hypothetical protein